MCDGKEVFAIALARLVNMVHSELNTGDRCALCEIPSARLPGGNGDIFCERHRDNSSISDVRG